ncbi:type IV pilin [Natronomonas marina]|uniref:type IV pilin n=1 Tax=Natronomonas marina TaxID=2961939 RepID=UPI0020C9593A|nr:type IV pilin N-terminal domain-containing protein [Natronomonas marina]
MKLNELLTDDDAVSPVIGVILMVAITVILAAVIGTFVLGLGDQVQSTTPQAQFTFNEPSSGDVDITHDGGDPVSADNVEVVDSNNNGPFCDGGSGDWGATEITAGDTCTDVSGLGSSEGTLRVTWESDDGSNSGTSEGTLRVTWESDDGSNSGTLATYDYDFT